MGHIKKNKNLLIIVVACVVTLIFYFWLINQSFFGAFVAWSLDHLLIYFLVMVFFKALAIVWPPLPGGLFTFGSIVVIGWQYAFLGQVVGGLLGGSVAYFLGRKYGFSMLAMFFDDSVIERIKKIKIYKHREFEALFFLRIFTTTISEAISYGSGLIGIGFRNFFFATLCGFVFELPIFYLAQSILQGKNLWLSGALFLVAGLLFYKLKGRYFE
ncbi:MAG TPA: VTT domain-containing protein [Candidatus Paceibacterota bacterium]